MAELLPTTDGHCARCGRSLPDNQSPYGAWLPTAYRAITTTATTATTAQTVEEVGTGAGEGATGQDTGTAWVTRSTDCPEAPAQAHLLDPSTPTGSTSERSHA